MEVDSTDYAGLVEIRFGTYRFEIAYLREYSHALAEWIEGSTRTIVHGCDCLEVMSDDEAYSIYQALGRYLADRGYFNEEDE